MFFLRFSVCSSTFFNRTFIPPRFEKEVSLHEAGTWATVKLFSRSLSLPVTTIMLRIDRNPYRLRAKYTHFRILVIGRANAGKTTLLQRVCNTTEDPCIYDDNKNLVSVQRPEDDEFCFWYFQLAWTYFSGTPFIIDIYQCADSTHISEGYMISIGRSHSRTTPDLSSTIHLDLRRATISNYRKSYRSWRRKQGRRKWAINCMLFGQFRYLGVH